jgi:hypothetical protein
MVHTHNNVVINNLETTKTNRKLPNIVPGPYGPHGDMLSISEGNIFES